nr:uncharacterized protein LOC129267210 [Lytechinus pictus]
MYVQEDSPTSITCKSIGSFPAVELALDLLGYSGIIPINNSSKTPNLFDERLFDTETTIKIRPTKTDHGKYIQCYAFMDSEVVGQNLSKLRVYGLPDDATITIPADLQDGMETNVTCRTSNGYPAPLIHWYIGSRNLTDNSSLKSSLNKADRYDAVSTLTFIPKRVHHGQRLLCQAVQPETPLGRSVNDSMVLNIWYGPIASISVRQLNVKGVHVGVILTCTSDANPPAFTIHWFCDCTELQGCHNTSFNDTVIECDTLTSTELTTGKPRSGDHCEFRCVAISTFGEGTAVLNSSFYGSHAFKVSIQTDNSLPVIGEDLTLVCSFTPETRYRRIVWTKGSNIQVASHSCSPYPFTTYLDPEKFSLAADTSSGNLTIHSLDETDGDIYTCSLSSTKGAWKPGSNSMQVTPLQPAPPFRIRVIIDEKSNRSYFQNTNITVTAGQQLNITCEAYWARPPAVLQWHVPYDLVALSRDHSNAIHVGLLDNLYISQKAVIIKPFKNDQGRIIKCTASHPKLQSNLQISVHLNVHVLPSSMLLFVPRAKGHQEHGTLSRSLYIKEDSTTSVTCKAIGSFPATELEWYFPNGNVSILNITKTRSVVSDNILVDTETSITILPGKEDHG